MLRHRTRKQSDKVIGNKKFTPIDAYPLGKLPTLKNVINTCQYHKNYRTDKTLSIVSGELFNLRIKYNAYPISIAGIRRRLKTEMTEFSRLYRYDKKKRKKNITVMFTIFLKKVKFSLVFSERIKTCDQR